MMRAAVVLASLFVLLGPGKSRAAFHLSLIHEFMSNAGGNPNAEYVEIRMLSANQNFVAHTRLTAFNCDGTAHTVLISDLPGNVLSGMNRRWIMASTSPIGGITPDFTFPAGLFSPCGMICWGAPGTTFPSNPPTWDASNPDNYTTCVAYGGYTGPKGSVNTTETSEALGSSTFSLERTSDGTDFGLACPSPENNAMAVGNFGPCTPPTTTTTSTSTSTSTTIGAVPFGDDDAGCVPDTADHLKCSATITKAFSKLITFVIGCHCKQATALFNTVPSANADEEACEETGAKAAKAKFDAAITKLQGLGICTATQLSNANAERDALLTYLDATLNGGIYCDGSTPLSPDDAGFIPVDKDKLKCECTVGKNLSKLIASTLKCHIKLADADFKAKAFDEEACEDHDPVSMKAAHDKYSSAVTKLLGKGICPMCLDTSAEHETLATDVLNKADGEVNAQAYPCN